MNQNPQMGFANVEDPWKEKHDVAATQQVIQQMLAGGTPNWVKWPHEYKAMARESYLADKENSERMAAQYKWDDQDQLTNRQARMVNAMSTKDFIQKLRSNGVKCFTIDNGFPPQTVAMWAIPPNRTDKARYVCYLQVPAMYEWSVLKLDAHGIPAGEDFRGWRTVLVQLVEKEIITEAQCHAWFGVPSPNVISARYFRSLWEKRNGKPYEDLEDRG